MAKMSNSLVKQFAKTITQSVPQEKSKSSKALGTLVKEGDIFYAMLDGSTFLTPVSMSMSGEEGDRVLVTIQNHSAIVTSNITAPGATTKYVERVEADLTTFKDVTVKNLLANYIRTDELEAKVGTFGYLKVETAEATYLKTVELEAKVGTFGYLKSDQLESEVAKFGYLKTGELAADVAKLGYLKVTDAEATYLKVDELEGKVGTFGYLKVSELEGAVGKFGYLTADQASLKYAQIDFANVTGQVVGTSLIKDGAITDAKILGLSANKITAGILDAAKITVTNLNADNITVGTLNGKLIGTGSVDLNKLAEEVPTKEYLDSVQNGLQDQIDKSIQTYTVTAIPLLNNEPAQDWAIEEYPKHVGDVCYVVNPGGQADGYTYRFEKDGDAYGWSLIKDSQVTEALQKLLNVDGDLSGLKSFQSETSSWITKTDSELSSVKSRTTTIETTYSTKEEAKNLAEDAKNGAIDEAAKDATSKANKAKTDAINTAASDATSKANSAKSEAISAAASDATSKANSALDNAKKYADDAVDGIEIGGRNLALNSADLTKWSIESGMKIEKEGDWFKLTNVSQEYISRYGIYIDVPIEKNTAYTFAVTMKPGNVNPSFGGGPGTSWGNDYKSSDKEGRLVQVVPSSSTNTNWRIYLYLKGTIPGQYAYFKLPKLEKGTKATDWTPAPEDIDQALSTKVETTTFNEVKQTVDTNSAKITQMTKTLKQKADGSAVESLQQTVNTVQQTANENVSKISQVTQSVEKAQSTANTAKERTETISQTVNEIKQTADSNSAKITQMNQTVAQKADGSKVTKLEERTSLVEQNLSGFKSEVGSTYTTKTEFDNLESTYNSYVQQTDSKIAAKLESSTFNSFQNGEYSNFKKSTNEFIGTSEAWEMRWNKIFNGTNAKEDTYQSYITFQNGEQILGNSKSNIKLHLKNDVIQFEDSNGNALASFDAANIYLGKNSTSAIIDICNGTGKISNVPPASGYRGLTIEGTDMTSIKSRYDVYLSTMAETDTETYGSSIELSTTDTPWYGDTAHGGTINLRSKGGNHVGSIVLSDGEIMLTVQDDANIAFLQILNTENRVTLAGNQIHFAGKTYPEQGIFLPSNGTWWVGGKTATNCIVACKQTTGGYHPAFRINSAGGHVWNIGGINNEIGFYGFKASRADNDNGVDFYTRWDMNNWDLIHSGYFEAQGLINTKSEYRSWHGGRDWRFGAQTGTGDDNQFGFYDTTYGHHGSIVGSDHSLRMIGDIFVGCLKTKNENVGIHFGGHKNNNAVYLYVPMDTQNLWLQTRVNSNTSSASWAWYNVTGLLQKSSSDKRLKTNVRFSNVNALDAIDRMRVRSFNRIDEGGLYYSIGFIADELEEINQNLVSGGGYTEDGHPYYKSINGIYLTSYAIKGIQELHKKVNEQKNKIDQQSSQLQSALGQIEALRNKLHELEMAM